MSRQQLLVFSGVGAAGNPDGALTQGFSEADRGRTDIIRNIHIEFDASGDLNISRSHSNPAKPLRVFLGLCSHPTDAFNNWNRHTTYPPIPPSRSFRQAGVDQKNRHPTVSALADHIGPDFRFHDHQDAGVNPIQKAPNTSWRVVRSIGIGYSVTKHLPGLGQPGISHGSHQDGRTQVTGQQAPDHGAGSNGFTHGNCVNPDNRPVHLGHQSQPMLPVLPQGRRLATLPPEPDKNERQGKANQQGIDKLEHAGLPAKQCVIIGLNLMWMGILPPAQTFVDAGFTILKKKYRKLPRNTDYSAYRHPRWWPTWLGIAVMWLAAQLPIRFQWWLGKIIGLVAWKLAKTRRHIIETNIRLCFPELNKHQQDALVRNAFIANGIGRSEERRVG